MPAEPFTTRPPRRGAALRYTLARRGAALRYTLALLVLGSCLGVPVGPFVAAQTRPDDSTSVTSGSPASAPPSDAVREHFETRVRPLLATHCYECHSKQSEKLRAGLRLDSRTAILEGGESGAVLVPGRPEESPLMAAVRHETVAMPPSAKLSDEQIADLERWIREGAWWPEESTGEQGRPSESASSPAAEREARKAAHWSWRPLARPAVPDVGDRAWPRNEVDRFILAGLESVGLPVASEASRATLLRRLSFDLRGLPPTVQEMEAFLADTAPDAYERLVDRLLATPQFGEKWARHWLDLVRFGETLGHEFDYPLHHAYQYRDYVVRAWNDDLSYDQFVREHIAGDLLPAPRINPSSGSNESIAGTGFWWLGEANHAPTDVRADEADRMDNQLSVFGKTFLGLTIGCARCHDHKFDPIPTADYYALAGFLQSTRRQEALLDPGGKIEAAVCELQAVRGEIDTELRRSLSAEAHTADYWTRHLLAATSAAPSTMPDGSLPLDEHLVERLRQALGDQQIASPAHPLHLWRQLTNVEDTASFEDRDRAAAQTWSRQWQEAARSWEGRQVFADFTRRDLSGWFLTGQAFQKSAVSMPGASDWSTGLQPPQLVRPGTVDSGLLGKRLQGVLRSPTFTLEHPQIHHLIRGRNVQIRLIVDGYVMDLFNPLLFADHMLRDVNTNGQYQWVTQRNDLSHSLGHKAHLEYIDHGDGEFALAAVVFSAEGPPTEVPSARVANWFEPSSTDGPEETGVSPERSRETLAEFYGRWIHDVLAQGDSGSGGTGHGESTSKTANDDRELLNWLLRQELVFRNRGDQQRAWTERLQALESRLPTPIPVLAATDGSPEDEYLHVRGSSRNRGPDVPRRMLTVIAGDDQPPIVDGSGRLELANRMLDESNPFPARVIVNRLWHHLLGKGIVPTVDDFGVMGQSPSHPELLDWLASDLRAHGWSLKRTLRLLLTSSTYRMASERGSAEVEERDSSNERWHRREVRRLTAEGLHDSILALTGRLDHRLYGPSVPVHLDDFVVGRGRPESGPLDRDGRRSLYVRVQRNFMSPLLLAFDMPTPFGTVGRRSDSNVPAQSLILMNDAFVWDQARGWAQRLQMVSPDPRTRVRTAVREAWGREASAAEEQRLLQFLDDQARAHGVPSDDERVWTDLCHALFNTKDFLFIH